jgi:ribosome-binding protein aMBF1 (putative translation factor)
MNQEFLVKCFLFEKDYNIFSQIVKEGLEIYSLSYKDFAKEFNTMPSSVKLWESGLIKPKLKTQREVVNFFKEKLKNENNI